MNAPATEVDNPFRNAPVAAAPANDAMVAVGSAREVAEVQASMTIARRFPRDEVVVMDKILQACTRPTLAEGALYEYARGGTDIRGPSIRLAECVAQYWGHLDFGWRVVEERPGATKVQTFCWDMQSGVRSQVVFDVAHERHTRSGKQVLHDPRDIYELVANNAARRLRACILRTIPGDVVEAAVRQCEQTLKLKVQVTPERLSNLVAQFAELGVTQAQVEKRIQRRLDAITPGIMVQLGKIYTSLRDGMSQAGDWFEVQTAAQQAPGSPQAKPEAASPRQQVREKLQARKAAARTEPAKAAPPPAADEAPQPSQAFQDIVRFAKVAASAEDMDRVRQIAQQLTDPDEALLAQEHINAAQARIGET